MKAILGILAIIFIIAAVVLMFIHPAGIVIAAPSLLLIGKMLAKASN